jgi:MYXO-CTERM domain-containing protein
MAFDASTLFKGAGGAAQLTPWGAGLSVAADTIATPNTSDAKGGQIGPGSFTFGGIQTGGAQGALGGIPWYGYAALALIAVAFIAARRR